MRVSIRSVFGSIALLIAAIVLMPTKAGATTYTYTETVDPSTATCGSSGNCFIILAAYAPIFGSAGPTLAAGDVVDINVTFTTPFTVDGATAQSAIYAAVLDSNYYNCAGINLPACLPQTSDLATSTETLIGENAGGPTVTTGNNFSESGFYVAYANVVGPNSGFSVTGFDATLTAVNGDPFPIAAVAIESQTFAAPNQSVPEPATLSMLGFGLVGLGLKRWRKTV